MNTTSRPTASLATENFNDETLALLEAIEVELPEFGDLDLDVAFGTPLEMFEPAGTQREMRRYAAEILAAPVDQRYALSLVHGAEITARIDVARDIVVGDLTTMKLVRERLVDFLLPYAAQLRITPPVTAT
ncbi:hypothetical protein [Streptomyces californicus]|uniref:hypothetical protein n=1 Tax=Streptomyces californicus TaxID=67351 RepID=UPI00296EEAB8|nr:hypothetical protein [Streptomyces californicus]MDW4917371.1 hypothetical protein [Streptomyces californicus]